MSNNTDETEVQGCDDERDELANPGRRRFLQVAAGALVSQGLFSGCRPAGSTVNLAALTDSQKAGKRKQPSPVSIFKCATYEELAHKKLKAYTDKLEVPDVKGKKVLLKINMVDHKPDLQLTTDVAVITAAVQFMSDLGASEILVGDAAALNRDTEYLLAATGIGECCKKAGVQFVDLNVDDIDKVDNHLGLTKEKFFAFPRSVVRSDVVVSLPKLKTHRWALMTCALKNFFGAIPGRAYGWPKNLLHVNGIDQSIVDLVAAIKPSFTIVDSIVSMEGHGPLDGNPKPTGYIVMGPDLTAVDAVCCRAMNFDPVDIPYLCLAEEVLGNTKMENIKLTGESIEAVKQDFMLPRTYKRLPSGRIMDASAEGSSSSGAT